MERPGSDRAETVAGRLARRIRAFGRDHANARVLAAARATIIDTVGVALAGMHEDCVRLLREVPGITSAPGPCLVFGSRRRTSALDATLVNGTAAHALDYDDLSGVMGGHPSVPLVPALFALAEERHLPGIAVLLSYIVGVETEVRLARAVHPCHYDKGWHPTATLGTIGAAAAAAHLLGLEQPRMARALALAASLSAGLKANFGTMTKPLHVGQCGRNGLLAALLAERGFTANPAAFEHGQGFFEVLNGPGAYDPDAIFAGWAEPLEIEADTIALKQFPCCGSAHPAIAMALQLLAEEGLSTDEIARIEILPHSRRLRHTDNPRPRSALEAKFSVQYCVARALVDGAVRLGHFENGAWAEPEILGLLAVTEARPHPEMADDAAEQWGAEVIVTTHDGRRLARRVNQLVGRGGANAMTPAELREKFDDCARRCLPAERVAPLFESLSTLEEAADMAEVARLIEGPPG